jgi:hypothetical protein
MSRAKSLAAAATVIMLLKRREKCLKCGLESGFQEQNKKGLTENYNFIKHFIALKNAHISRLTIKFSLYPTSLVATVIRPFFLASTEGFKFVTNK